MAAGILKMDGRKFFVIPEEEYKFPRGAARKQAREDELDALDLVEAKRRMNSVRDKSIALPVARRALARR